MYPGLASWAKFSRPFGTHGTPGQAKFQIPSRSGGTVLFGLFFRATQLRDNGKVLEGGGIALDFSAGRELAQ